MWPFKKKNLRDMENLKRTSEPVLAYDVYYAMKFKEIPSELFPKIKQIFDDNLGQNFINDAKNLIEEKGLNNWFIDHHFFLGMQIRNLLRDNGILDSMFPDKNLDDYYIVMLEWWLGYR